MRGIEVGQTVYTREVDEGVALELRDHPGLCGPELWHVDGYGIARPALVRAQAEAGRLTPWRPERLRSPAESRQPVRPAQDVTGIAAEPERLATLHKSGMLDTRKG